MGAQNVRKAWRSRAFHLAQRGAARNYLVICSATSCINGTAALAETGAKLVGLLGDPLCKAPGRGNKLKGVLRRFGAKWGAASSRQAASGGSTWSGFFYGRTGESTGDGVGRTAGRWRRLQQRGAKRRPRAMDHGVGACRHGRQVEEGRRCSRKTWRHGAFLPQKLQRTWIPHRRAARHRDLPPGPSAACLAPFVTFCSGRRAGDGSGGNGAPPDPAQENRPICCS